MLGLLPTPPPQVATAAAAAAAAALVNEKKNTQSPQTEAEELVLLRRRRSFKQRAHRDRQAHIAHQQSSVCMYVVSRALRYLRRRRVMRRERVQKRNCTYVCTNSSACQGFTQTELEEGKEEGEGEEILLIKETLRGWQHHDKKKGTKRGSKLNIRGQKVHLQTFCLLACFIIAAV